MNKLIQSIILSAVVLAPVSSLDLFADATMPHTPSHVSNISLEVAHTRQTPHKHRKYRKVRVKAKKSVTKRSPSQKPISREQTPSEPTTTTPTSTPPESTPSTSTPSTSTPPKFIPLTPGNFLPATQLKPIDPIMGNPVNPPSPDVILPNPASGTPTIPLSIPGGIPNPSGDTSIPNPNLPTTFPGGAIN
jgi:hypothetical protein